MDKDFLDFHTGTDIEGTVGPKGKVYDITMLTSEEYGKWYLIDEIGMLFPEDDGLKEFVPFYKRAIEPDSDLYKQIIARITALRLMQ